jgi:hypothetical protein
MFKKKEKTQISPTGFFIVVEKTIKPLDILPKQGSFNDIAESIGILKYHGIICFNSLKFEYIAFKPKSKDVIFFEVKDKSIPISFNDLKNAISEEIDWNFEFSIQS